MGMDGPFDLVCFHCQQAVEKFMKGLLAFNEIDFPFTHDLGLLAPLFVKLDATLVLTTPEVLKLSDYAVKLRYDGRFRPDIREASFAVEVATRVCDMIAARLPADLDK